MDRKNKFNNTHKKNRFSLDCMYLKVTWIINLNSLYLWEPKLKSIPGAFVVGTDTSLNWFLVLQGQTGTSSSKKRRKIL